MTEEIIARLSSLIEIPSFSREENQTADFLEKELTKTGFLPERIANNVIARSVHWADTKPVVLLNSHHDTVRPASTYSRNPFKAIIEAEKLYGLGSNDAGAALSTLLQVFRDFGHRDDLPFNLIFIASAEEEISGSGGIALALKEIPRPAAAIVGEPTLMKAAVAERGLMVVDGMTMGVSGHAARKEGVNALYLALEDILRIRELVFEKPSEFLPDTQAVVTQLSAGTQHNVIPDRCEFVIDVRVNDRYSNHEVFEILQSRVKSTLKARSFRLNSSFLPREHPLFQAVIRLGLDTYGSPTLSDQALMDFPSLKIGPGDSARSHTADEFVYLREIEEGYKIYHNLLEVLITTMS